jgi:excisionase family DNA binding protein
MESYWKVQDVAVALKISVQTVYRYVANEEIPFYKLNRSVRFKPSEIELWIENKTAGMRVASNEGLDERVMESAGTEGGEA